MRVLIDHRMVSMLVLEDESGHGFEVGRCAFGFDASVATKLMTMRAAKPCEDSS